MSSHHSHHHDSLSEQQRHQQGLQGLQPGQNVVLLQQGNLVQDHNLVGLSGGQHLHQQNAGVTVITRDVALVEEKIHSHEEQHIQPILTRDIEQKEVRQVIQPMHETIVNATQHSAATLAQKELFVNNDRAIAPQIVPEAVRIQGQADVNVVQHAAIVEERVHRQIIEEVQPVLYRDVIQNREVVITQPIHERIIEAPVLIQETRGMVEMTGSTYAHSNVTGNFAHGTIVQGQVLQGQPLHGQVLQGQVLHGQGLQGQNIQQGLAHGQQQFQQGQQQHHHDQGLAQGSLHDRAVAKYGEHGHSGHGVQGHQAH